jgi:hypothetical protein
MDRLAAVTLQAPWLIPYRDQAEWMVPAASLVLVVPFYAASVLAEYLVLRSRWGRTTGRLLPGVAWGNGLSYTLLAAYYVAQLWLARDSGSA